VQEGAVDHAELSVAARLAERPASQHVYVSSRRYNALKSLVRPVFVLHHSRRCRHVERAVRTRRRRGESQLQRVRKAGSLEILQQAIDSPR